MTLTLLLQLTDEEQLYATAPQPAVIEVELPQPVQAPVLEIVLPALEEEQA